MSQIFRQSALDKLANPEELDQLITLTSPRSWIFLSGLLVVLAIFLLWGVFGTIDTRIDGQGMLLSGRVHDVVPRYGGQIRALWVEPGDHIDRSTVVAELAQPALTRELNEARTRLSELQREAESLRRFGLEEGELQQEVAVQRRSNLETLINEAERRAERLTDQIEIEQGLLQEGLITRSRLAQTQQAYESTLDLINQYRADLTNLDAVTRSSEFELEQRVESMDIRIEDARRQIAQLEEDLQTQTRVQSPFDGEVLQMLVSEGDIVSPGTGILKVALAEHEEQELRVLVYVPLQDGKKIRSGLPIEISPATVKPEEYGYIRGVITQIATFPSTPRSMLNVLGNEQLVQQLSMQGAPFQLEARLERDSTTFSGYAWTSGQGPQIEIHSGTPISGWSIVDEQRPIELVIPAVRKALSF